MGTKLMVNLPNIAKNIEIVEHLVEENSIVTTKTKICVSIKANAYGHGLEEVATYLSSRASVDYWGVAALSEAERLRALPIKGNIISYIQFEREDLEKALVLGVELFVGDKQYLALVQRISKEKNIVANVHMMIETGMGRFGFLEEECKEIIEHCKKAENINLVGVCSHLLDSSSDEWANKQLDIFDRILESLSLPDTIIRHIANSGAILWQNKRALYDMVRPGIMLYGSSPNPQREQAEELNLSRTMQLIGHIGSLHRYSSGQTISYNANYICEKESNIAVVNMGYGDGLMRSLGNRGIVSIDGKRYPIVGNVCMDMCMVNLGDEMYDLGTEVVFFGDDSIGIDEQSELAETISYVLLTQVTQRANRIYLS